MSPNLLLIFVGFGVLILGLVGIIIGWRMASRAEMDRRMQEFVIEPASLPGYWPVDNLVVRRPELRGSFISRAILPFLRNVAGFFGRFTPASSIQSISRQLEAAGNPMRLGAREFYGLSLIFIGLGVGLGYLFYLRVPRFGLLVGLLAFLILAAFPRVWLRGRVRRRRNRIQRSLPDALDMLSVCADAGLGFDQSLQRVSESWKTDLGREFARVVKEMSLGISRSTALRSLAKRLNVSELSSFVAVILQSDQLGMSIADVLHAQANQMRIERRYWAQEQARKLPIKMLFPLVFLILPALFVIVLGPAFVRIISLFSGPLGGG